MGAQQHTPRDDAAGPAEDWIQATATYGSDQGGLVCAYTFTPGSRARAVDSIEAGTLLAGRTSDAEFLWLHFALANAASERWLRLHDVVPQTFFALSSDRSTHIEVSDDALLGVLNDVQFHAPDPSSVAMVALHVSRHMLVTARTTPVRALDRLRAAVKGGEAFASPVELFAHLLRDQADVLVEIVRDATTQVDAIEDRILTRQRSSRPQLGQIRRVLVRLQRLLAPEPAALFRLLNRPPLWLTDTDLAGLRQSAEELAAAVADSVALGERVRLLQEELTAMLTERTNETLFILTVVTVLALPMTIIPGLFGMNVPGVPFAHHPGGFWLVVVLVIGIVGAGVALAWTRRDRG